MEKWLKFSLIFTFCLVISACKQLSQDNSNGNTAILSEPSSSNEAILKIAFGSCNDEDRAQPLWTNLEKENADLFLWLGDNIYGDSDDMEVLSQKYAIQNAHPDYKKFKLNTPINGTWDDHDYGANDGGKEFEQKDGSQQLLLDFLDIPKDHPRRTRKGVYDKISLVKHGVDISIFILDTRYFRDVLIGKRGKYKGDSKGTILGEAQWSWLEDELSSSQADIHIFASSIQLIPEEHGWEKWANYPQEKTKFLDLLASYNIQYPIILSGDRHTAEFAVQHWKGVTLYDLTSSSLTHCVKTPRPEKNKFRLEGTDLIFKENYGILEITKGENIEITAKIKTGITNSVISSQLFAEAKK